MGARGGLSDQAASLYKEWRQERDAEVSQVVQCKKLKKVRES